MPSKKSTKPLKLSRSITWGSVVQRRGDKIIAAGSRTRRDKILGVFHPAAEKMIIRTICLDGSISRIIVLTPAGIRTNGMDNINVYKGN